PFRLKEYISGQRVVLERNPHYWKVDRNGVRLPYLDRIAIVFVPTTDAQAIRFESGELHVIDGLSAENFRLLGKQVVGFELRDAGAGFQFDFLVFNLKDPPPPDATVQRKRSWFRELGFRRAVSAAIDREAVVRIA